MPWSRRASGCSTFCSPGRAPSRRYVILRDPTIEEIYWSRSKEFGTVLTQLGQNALPATGEAVSLLSRLHGQYENFFTQEVSLVKAGRSDQAQALSEGEGSRTIDQMADLIRGIQKRAEGNIDARMGQITFQGLRASRLTFVLSLVSLVVGLGLVMLVTYNISRPLRRLERATALIAEGKFDYDLRLDRHDEIGSLAKASP